MENLAIISITKHGVALGARLQELMAGDATLFVPTKFAADAPSGTPFTESVREFIGKAFHEYDGLVIFISLGAVVRMIAEHLQDKHVDPAVVVVDDRARFAIALLSGHVGGANALTRRVAQLMGAQPVITTASDVGETIPVDIFGQEFGWQLEGWDKVTSISASVVNEEKIGIYQDAGERDWWRYDRPLPSYIQLFSSLDDLKGSGCKAALIITDKVLGEEYSGLLKKAVLYRPKTLSVGIGCMKGVPQEDIEKAVLSTLAGHCLSPLSIKNVATIDVKREEAGILEFAEKYRLPIDFYGQDSLNKVENITAPSEAAQKYVGAIGVCEPAAILAAGATNLLVPKQKFGTITVAVARRQYEEGR